MAGFPAEDVALASRFGGNRVDVGTVLLRPWTECEGPLAMIEDPGMGRNPGESNVPKAPGRFGQAGRARGEQRLSVWFETFADPAHELP